MVGMGISTAEAGSVRYGVFDHATKVAFGSPNTTMFQNQYTVSADGRFGLIMQGDGNLVLYGPSPCGAFQPNICRGPYDYWSTNTGGQPGNRVVLQTDGNLVVYRPNNSVAWASNTGGSGVTQLSLTNKGSLSLKRPDGSVAKWLFSGLDICNSYVGFVGQMPNDSRLNTCSYGASPNGVYHLMQQQDGNLVLYGPANHVLWATGTAQQVIGDYSHRYAQMQYDGNFVVYDGNTPVWASNTAGFPEARLVLQDDGNLVIYSGSGQPVWSSNTGGQI
ncbi:hypothetical protein ACFQ1I_46420 [Kitasatospora arboriphila]